MDGGSSEFVGPRQRWLASEGSTAERLYGQMWLIREFEERLLSLFEEGVLTGTTHACIGQEADCVGVINHLETGDVIFSNHRCHGHFLAYADRPEWLAAEIMGRGAGLVGGRGGSQHICYEDFFSNGVQGGIVPVATGIAMAEKARGTGRIVCVFLGDGTLGQGVVYEALNMASLWSAPILFVVEDNRWAQSTPVEKELSGSMVARGEAFGGASSEITSTDAEEIYGHFEGIVAAVRKTGRPHLGVIHTYRLCHHSKSDDMRPEEEVEARRALDPVPLLRSRLDEERASAIEAAVQKRLEEAFSWALDQPHPAAETLRDPLSTS